MHREYITFTKTIFKTISIALLKNAIFIIIKKYKNIKFVKNNKKMRNGRNIFEIKSRVFKKNNWVYFNVIWSC